MFNLTEQLCTKLHRQYKTPSFKLLFGQVPAAPLPWRPEPPLLTETTAFPLQNDVLSSTDESMCDLHNVGSAVSLS